MVCVTLAMRWSTAAIACAVPSVSDVERRFRRESIECSAWMRSHAARIQAGDTLLDVACGRGRHARYFAERGARVTAVDRDAEALTALADVANVLTEARDLEGAPWPYAAASFDAVLVCNYLWRPALSDLLDTVRPGGVLLYETFMVGNEVYGKPSRPDFLLRPNELITSVALDFEVVEFRQGLQRDGTHP